MIKPQGIVANVEDLHQQNSELAARLEAAQLVIDRLTENEFRQNELFALMTDAVFIQQDGKIVFANPTAARLHGFDTPDELVGVDTSDLIPEDDLELILSRRQELSTGAKLFPVERQRLRRDGTRFTGETRGSQITWEGQPAVLVVLRDITARKQAEREAAEKSALLSTTLEIMGHGYCVFDAESRLVGFNKKYVDVYQFPPGFVRLGMQHEEILRMLARKGYFGDGDRKEQVRRRLESANAGEAGTNEHASPDGVTHIYQRRPMPGGGFVATFTDITERKQAERELHDSEARYRGLIDESILPIQISTVDRSFLYVNQAYLDLLGYDTGEEFFEQRARVIAPHDRDRIIKMADARKKGEDVPDIYEYDAVKKDGTIVPLQAFSRKIIWEGKAAYQRTLIDLTKRKEAEKASFESEEKLRKAFENTGIGITIRNTADRTIICNDAICKMLGYSREELEALHFNDITHPEDRKENQRLRRKLFSGETDSHQISKRFIRKNGETIWCIQDLSTIRDDQGKVLFTINLYQDLTETRKAEELLRQAQKMEAVGQLTGGVAHDFNNLLTIIQGNLAMMVDQLQETEMVRMAESALKAAKRGAQLTHRLLAFSRKQMLAPEVIQLDELVADMFDLMRRTLGETIAIDVATDDSLWNCKVDPGQLENAILNLALNARDAMPQGGKLTIKTANIELSQPELAPQNIVPPGDYVMVSVADTGTGMSPNDLEHAFEPFFTTKDVGAGSGLGLSMVHGFISQSHGFVTIDSTAGEGTTVQMYLPRSADTRRPAPQKAATEDPVSRGELILVVEDDPDVRSFTVVLLDSLGYDTVEAGDGKQAMEVLKNTPGIDLLFTDVVLPGDMSGVEIARDAAKLVPGIKTLFTSGYADDVLARHGQTYENIPLVSKPFQITDLARHLRTVLDEVAG